MEGPRGVAMRRNLHVPVLILLLIAAGLTYLGDRYLTSQVICGTEWCTRVEED
jgi:hypothetical protein